MFTPSMYYNLTTKKIGDVQAYEKAREDFENEYNKFVDFPNSADFRRLQELDGWVETKEPERIKRQLAAMTYKNSEEYQHEVEFMRMTKSTQFRNYLKHTHSGLPEFFNQVKESGKPDEFMELQNFVNSPDYKSHAREYKKGNTDEYKKALRYKELKSDPDLKQFFKLKKDKSLQHFFSIQNSTTLVRYNQLKEEVNSTEFMERKKYLLSRDKFKQSEAFAKLEERKRLQNSEDRIWYLKTLKHNKFDDVKAWNLSFNETFEGTEIDQNRWLTRFYWGDKFLNNSYSFFNQKQCYTELNVEQSDGLLSLETREEQAEGLAWHQEFGLMPKKFAYTSGTINTGKSYRQTSGRIEAKVKMTCSPGIFHTMYLVGDKQLPQIDVFCKNDCDTTAVNAGLYHQKGKKTVRNIKTIRQLDLVSPNIYSVEWDEKKITWAINGTIYKTERNVAPGMPLYMVFASGVNGEVGPNDVPARMQISWVKCWVKGEVPKPQPLEEEQ